MNLLIRLKRRGLRLSSYVRGTAVILAYHRVIDLPNDPQFLCVNPSRFQQHLEVLRAGFRCLSLKQAADGLERGCLPPRSVVITFDDGYFDNLLEAKPLLERFDVPATVFVSTGYLGRQREFWWDELERILLVPPHVPPTLGVEIGGAKYRWDTLTGSQRSFAYNELIRLVHPLPPSQREQTLDALRRWGGVSEQGRATHRALTPNEVNQLGNNGLVDVGAHTVSHPMLGALPIEEQREEIIGSCRTLEQITGRRVDCFAYPYGGTEDFSDVTRAIVRAAGFRLACSTRRACARNGTNLWWLPRFILRDSNGPEFARRLDTYFGM